MYKVPKVLKNAIQMYAEKYKASIIIYLITRLGWKFNTKLFAILSRCLTLHIRVNLIQELLTERCH